ncbi:rhamnogalacturonan acetylesterase [Tothia fuscella]|uniref:Rhamnogalacturonan acetylesterase n=1 Tax=Tothia fuscella TaxID=1048955 RepID=A0A9P4U0P9_9PEZI|nr:rhamnogalacturonan acetylesterase [Tothia fuscella]
MKTSNITAAAAAVIASCPPICNAAYPKVLIAGDSTTANYDQSRMQGWGFYLNEYVNMSVMNLAKNGRSTRSFRNEGLWAQVLTLVQPGDFVIIEMGHNDDGDIRAKNNTRAYRHTLPGTGEEIIGYKALGANKTEVVHTFGWYLKQMAIDVREKSGIPIISSLTPRNSWSGGNKTTAMLNTNYKFRDYAKESAEAVKSDFVDHTSYSLRAFRELGQLETKKLFPLDNTHTGPEGARLNAETFIQAARCAGIEFADYLSEDGKAIENVACLE